MSQGRVARRLKDQLKELRLGSAESNREGMSELSSTDQGEMSYSGAVRRDMPSVPMPGSPGVGGAGLSPPMERSPEEVWTRRKNSLGQLVRRGRP